MKHNKVGSVMTTDVVRAEYGTPFKEVARLLADHRISGLPVVDEDDKVIGVISETDLIARQAATPEPYEPRRRFTFPGLTRGARRQAAKTNARTAGRLMTAPAITAHADDTIVEAARTMAQHQVERLPVLDEEDQPLRHRHPPEPAPGLPAPRQGDPRGGDRGRTGEHPVAGAPRHRRVRGGGRCHTHRPHGTQERDGDRPVDDPPDRRRGRRGRPAHLPAGRGAPAHPGTGAARRGRRLAAPIVRGGVSP
ncbi:CBS domain protein [Streptomyces ipomoeae 91-03]|uniref:CBS domain protein n=1 Tax=Streptomyces ipomoeae 91-03 TaxID=698759 RepID=L1L4J5_9ACTN|nr:CBS domain protein [Streptomyces ipomoeae 91-03]